MNQTVIFKYILSDLEKDEISVFLENSKTYSLFQDMEWLDITTHSQKCYSLIYENKTLISFSIIEEKHYGAFLFFGPICEPANLVFSINEIVNYYKSHFFLFDLIRSIISCSFALDKKSFIFLSNFLLYSKSE